MHRPLAVALLLLAAACLVLGVVASPAWWWAVGPALVLATGAWLRMSPARFLDAVDDGGDAGRGPAGLHP